MLLDGFIVVNSSVALHKCCWMTGVILEVCVPGRSNVILEATSEFFSCKMTLKKIPDCYNERKHAGSLEKPTKDPRVVLDDNQKEDTNVMECRTRLEFCSVAYMAFGGGARGCFYPGAHSPIILPGFQEPTSMWELRGCATEPPFSFKDHKWNSVREFQNGALVPCGKDKQVFCQVTNKHKQDLGTHWIFLAAGQTFCDILYSTALTQD